MIPLKISFVTDKGPFRQNNEDALINYANSLLGVADGMGGHLAGEVASNILKTTFIDEYKNHENLPLDFLINSIKIANHEIFKKASTNEEYRGMGSTIAISLIKDMILSWAHVGDSRIYLYRDKVLKQITEDHSFYSEIIKQKKELTTDFNKKDSKHILTRAVGVSYSVKIDSGNLKLEPKDTILICTDGLSDYLKEEEITKILESIDENKANTLVKKALEEGSRDNITVIVVEIND